MMIQRAGLRAVLSAMLFCACGGSAPVEGMPVEDTPVSGFYAVTTTTSDDTCGLTSLSDEHVELIEAYDKGLNLRIWPSIGQDVPWLGLPQAALKDCGATVGVSLNGLTTHSFVAVEDWNWTDPSTCDPHAFTVLPSAPCAVKTWRVFELGEACPAEVNGLGCGG